MRPNSATTANAQINQNASTQQNTIRETIKSLKKLIPRRASKPQENENTSITITTCLRESVEGEDTQQAVTSVECIEDGIHEGIRDQAQQECIESRESLQETQSKNLHSYNQKITELTRSAKIENYVLAIEYGYTRNVLVNTQSIPSHRGELIALNIRKLPPIKIEGVTHTYTIEQIMRQFIPQANSALYYRRLGIWIDDSRPIVSYNIPLQVTIFMHKSSSAEQCWT